jgi:hypothetical protein
VVERGTKAIAPCSFPFIVDEKELTSAQIIKILMEKCGVQQKLIPIP